jgi:hypothetical protein
MDVVAKLIFAVLVITSAVRSAAFAQTQSAQSQSVDPKACSDAVTNAPNQTLSDKLSQSNGVICPPPSVDPGIKAPAPDTGKMPVIPPPGSPGGDQSVQPK